MQPGTPPLELDAIKMIAGGDALARHPDGRAVLLTGALPEERVLARVVQTKRDFVRARTLSVSSPSSARRTAPCPQLAHGCGGCDWLHVEPARQVELKASVVRDALQRTARLDAPVIEGGRVPEAGYRTSLRLALDRAGRPGFRGARSHQIVTTRRCYVAHPQLEALLDRIELPGASELVLRVGARTGERLAWWQPDTVPRPATLDADVRTGSAACVHEQVAGTTLRVSAGSFFQSSPEAAELLVDAVRRAAGDPAGWADGPLIDAYGGIGLFACTLAPPDRPLVLVESNPSACADARVNLAGRDARIVVGTVESWQPERAGLVVADPARSGLGREAVARLAGTRSARLVLVSCDPVAFARDARLLADSGYRLESAEVLDLFPNTHHLEVVAAFRRS